MFTVYKISLKCVSPSAFHKCSINVAYTHIMMIQPCGLVVPQRFWILMLHTADNFLYKTDASYYDTFATLLRLVNKYLPFTIHIQWIIPSIQNNIIL